MVGGRPRHQLDGSHGGPGVRWHHLGLQEVSGEDVSECFEIHFGVEPIRTFCSTGFNWRQREGEESRRTCRVST